MIQNVNSATEHSVKEQASYERGSVLVENAAKEEKTILNKLKIYRRPEQPRVERFISSVSL